MNSTDRILGMYLHLARASHLRRQPLVRDRMLVLAGATAAEMGLSGVAAECRSRVLAHNPQHMLSNRPTMAAALEDERFQAHLNQLRRRLFTREGRTHAGGPGRRMDQRAGCLLH